VSKGKIAGWVAAIIVALILLTVLGKACGIIGGYANEAARVVSVENKKDQNYNIIESWEGMRVAAINACAAQKTTDTESMLLEDPAFAYAAQYQKISIEYNRRMDNIFEANNIIRPQDYPRDAPTLQEMQEEVCP